MPTRTHLVSVAKEIKRRLNGRAFHTMPRQEVTQMVRTVSGEDTTRVKSAMGDEIERVLLEQGIRLFPGLRDTQASDNIRFFHTGTLAATFVDILRYPDQDTDKQLAEIITKVKGQWTWANAPISPQAEEGAR